METNDFVKIAIISGATAVTIVNLCLNGDGVSIAALFGLFGTMLGYTIGSKVAQQNA